MCKLVGRWPLCVPFECSDQGVVFGRGLSECWLSCVFVFVCVVARFVLVQLGSHVDSNVFVCVKPAPVCQATCGTGFVLSCHLVGEWCLLVAGWCLLVAGW